MVLVVKNPPANVGDMRPEFGPWVGKFPWRRKCRPTPVFVLEESHGQRSLAGSGPGGRTELDTTEVTEQSVVFLKAGGNVSVG